MATPDRDDAIEEPLLSPGFTCRVERASEETPVRPPRPRFGSSPSRPATDRRRPPPPSALPQARDPRVAPGVVARPRRPRRRSRTSRREQTPLVRSSLGAFPPTPSRPSRPIPAPSPRRVVTDPEALTSPPASPLSQSLARPDARWLFLGLLSLLVRLPFSLAAPLSRSLSICVGACIDADLPARVARGLHRGGRGQRRAGLLERLFLFLRAEQTRPPSPRASLRAHTRARDGFFDVNSSGAIVGRLTSDCGAVASDLSWVFRNVVEAVVRVLGIAAYLCVQNLGLGLLACAIIPFVAFANRLYGEWMTENALKTQGMLSIEDVADVGAREAVANVRVVASFACETRETRAYETALLRWYRLCNRQAVVSGAYFLGGVFVLVASGARGALGVRFVVDAAAGDASRASGGVHAVPVAAAGVRGEPSRTRARACTGARGRRRGCSS